MNKKNTMLLTIIAVATLLVAVIGASFAYFNISSPINTPSTTITASSEALPSIALNQGESNLSIHLTNAQMSIENGGTSYWAQTGTDKDATTERKDTEIANINLTSGEEGKYYRCDANFIITPTSIPNFGKGNMKLHLGILDSSKSLVIEDTTVKSIVSSVYFKGPLDTVPITANLEVINSTENQDAANQDFTIKIDISLSNCNFVDNPQFISETIKNSYVSDTTQLGTIKEDGSGNDGYLIYHDGTGDYENSKYEAGDYSYRFSGNNPDNYVCLDGENKEGPCEPKKLYRIIGIFPTDASHTKYQTKLIKSEYLTYEETEDNLKSKYNGLTKYPSGWTSRVENQANIDGFYWSGSSSINWNNWKSSELNKALNKVDGVYLKPLESYITARLISDTTWYLGGNDWSKIVQQPNMKLAYENELGSGRLTPETGTKMCTDDSITKVDCTDELLYQTSKVGLMYATEYGYASEPASWTSQLIDYNNTGNKNREKNWLYNGVYEWLLTRSTADDASSFSVCSEGFVGGRDSLFYYQYGARPVLVLSSTAEILNGEGTKLNPWRIKVDLNEESN